MSSISETIPSTKEIKFPGEDKFKQLRHRIDGEVFTDNIHLTMYSTDASDYRERPMAVVYPQHEADIRELIRFASAENITLIPRTAGTSLAGQVVGSGVIVDVSHYINEKERWVNVQPGVVLDELNIALKHTGLFFSPETSTSSRSMIGGMIGNNSCGLHSIVHGTTRDHTISVKTVLSDGSDAEFGPLDQEMIKEKLEVDGMEGDIYRGIHRILLDPKNQKEILEHFPDPGVVRRNTGYALDELLNSSPFLGEKAKYSDYNLCRLISGSEGTLLFMTEAKLNLIPIPPPNRALVPIHFQSIMEAIRGNLVALRHKPTAVELMDSW